MDDFELIYAYSRKQAIYDGFQYQANPDTCKEIGIKFPVYLTSKVYKRYVQVPDELTGHQDEDGRLYDLLYMFAFIARCTSESVLSFRVCVSMPESLEWLQNEKHMDSVKHREVTLQSTIGPLDFDDPSPAITIMLPGED